MNYATIDGFEQLTNQQVFDISAKHLLAQNAKSLRTGGICLYRGAYGNQCAAGPFLKDDRALACEGLGWGGLIRCGSVPKAAANDLICELQTVHDSHAPVEWRQLLAEVAECFNLNTEVLS